MLSFKPRSNETFIIDLIIQKMSSFRMENKFKILERRKTFGNNVFPHIALKKCSHTIVIPFSVLKQELI